MARLLVFIVIVLEAIVAVRAQSRAAVITPELATITVRASALAEVVDELAGYPVNVPGARIVWVIDSRAMVIESAARLEPTPGNRNRVLVITSRGRSLVIPRTPVMTSPVTIIGTARTLLGVQVAHDVPWPPSLNANLLNRLEIRAAVVATSVQTPDGVELTSSDPRFEAP